MRTMHRALSTFPAVLALASAFAVTAADSTSATHDPLQRAVLPAEQVVRILDETVDWYRTLGAQEQAASQPSDLLILYANRQTANKVIALAFEIARANAELLSSDADRARAQSGASSPAHALLLAQKQLDVQRRSVQGEIDALRRTLTSARSKARQENGDRLAQLQGELDMINARRNLLDTMSEFTNQSDPAGARASALKAQIDAIAASIPALGPATASAQTAGAAALPSVRSVPEAVELSGQGLWALGSNVLRLSRKISTIGAIDQRTATLQATFEKIRTPPIEQLKALEARGDRLAQESDAAQGAALRGMRDQFDTLAWLFRQTSAILIPLTREAVLLKQYRYNLASWRTALQGQYRDAIKALAVRAGVLVLMLAGVFILAEIWRRAVFRYAQEARRRAQLLLIRRIALWVLVLIIVGTTFASELGSLVTFAGLITAGLAVAMQSILVSVVGYFFLIGKYGIRVGDRVQIGNVTGEVIELGLVRMHLMELNERGALGPTGRVVGFANSIVFQATGGLFKQIPGVNIAWHDTTIRLPAGCDAQAVKARMLEAVGHILQEYKVEIDRQSREIRKTTSSGVATDLQPQVQLKFSTEGVDAHVRYPVQLSLAAEIDERVSRELLAIVSTDEPA